MLPIDVMLDTHEALGDWVFTAEEAEQIITSVWTAVIEAMLLTFVTGVGGMWIGGKLNKEDELMHLEREIKRVAARVHDLEDNAAHAREHFSRLMGQYGYDVIPSEMELRKHYDMRVAKNRWDELERRTESLRGYLFKLIRRKKELTGEA